MVWFSFWYAYISFWETFLPPLVVEVDEICMSSNNLASRCGSQAKERCLQEIQKKIVFFYLHTWKRTMTFKNSLPFSGRIDKNQINSRMIKTFISLSRFFWLTQKSLSLHEGREIN